MFGFVLPDLIMIKIPMDQAHQAVKVFALILEVSVTNGRGFTWMEMNVGVPSKNTKTFLA